MQGVPAKKYRIKLTGDERKSLERIRDHGPHKSTKFKRTMVLLLCDEGPEGPAHIDTEIYQITGMKTATVERLRKRCCEVGPQGALLAKPRKTPPREIKITGEVEAHITQLACSEAPEGQARWTLTLLAERLVEIAVIDSISRTSVALVLKKANLNLGDKKGGVSHQKKTHPS
jgi:hypothetical protein